jgi:hypothetical protein
MTMPAEVRDTKPRSGTAVVPAATGLERDIRGNMEQDMATDPQARVRGSWQSRFVIPASTGVICAHGTEPSKKKQKAPLPGGGTVSARTLARVLLSALLRSVLAADGAWTPATLDARLLASLDRRPG